MMMLGYYVGFYAMLLKTLSISTGSVLVIKKVVSYLYNNINELEGVPIFQDLN